MTLMHRSDAVGRADVLEMPLFEIKVIALLFREQVQLLSAQIQISHKSKLLLAYLMRASPFGVCDLLLLLPHCLVTLVS